MSDADKKNPEIEDEGPAKVPGREAARRPLPKRFYKEVTVEQDGEAFAPALDGKRIRTPNKRPLRLPRRAFAEAVAVEWREQAERVDPETMPLTRLANTTIDAVADNPAAVAADIVAFAGSDLLCYRAEGPEALTERQRIAWDPILSWAERTFGGRFHIAVGVMHVPQPTETLTAIARSLENETAFRLAALHILTTLSGSALLALAHAHGVMGLDQAWTLAHIDEDWQIEQWGRDAEAEARARYRENEYKAAGRVLALA